MHQFCWTAGTRLSFLENLWASWTASLRFTNQCCTVMMKVMLGQNSCWTLDYSYSWSQLCHQHQHTIRDHQLMTYTGCRIPLSWRTIAALTTFKPTSIEYCVCSPWSSCLKKSSMSPNGPIKMITVSLLPSIMAITCWHEKIDDLQ